MKAEKPTPGEEAIIDGLRSIFYLLDERLPKEEPAWKRDGIIPTLQGSARAKEAERVDDATNARYEREDAEARQGDPDEALARVLFDVSEDHGDGTFAWSTALAMARAAREHIEAERDVRREVEQEAAEGRIDSLEALAVEQQRRAEKAEDELRGACNSWQSAAQEAEYLSEKFRAERDGWKAKHAALREDVAHEEASRHYGFLRAILDRDDNRDPQADPDAVTLRRDDAEALLSQWEDRGYHETDEGTDPLYSRVRAALGRGDEA